jgi:hypothetical protein
LPYPSHVWPPFSGTCIQYLLWFLIPHVRENMQLLAFWAWLISLKMIKNQ